LRNDGNPDVDGYTKTLNQRKMLKINGKPLRNAKKRQPTENQKNTKYKLRGGGIIQPYAPDLL